MVNASQNKPVKEFIYTLVGVGVFLGVVLLIGVSAFLRPAGEHVTTEVPLENTADVVVENIAS